MDDILKIVANGIEIIPQQRTYSNKVSIITNESPKRAGTYAIMNNSEVLESVSYNYDRNESRLNSDKIINALASLWAQVLIACCCSC